VGIIGVQAVRQDAAVFGVNGTPAVISSENPIVPVPGHTRGLFVDAFIVDPSNSDNPLAAVYVAMSGRGSGTWPGGFLFREFPSTSGNYIQVSSSDRPATTGVTAGTLGTTTNFTTIDAVNSVVVDLYYGELESVTEAELLANPTLNLLYIGSEYVQFQTATPGTAVAPFVRRYTLTNFLRGRYYTDSAAPLHATGESCALINSALKIVPVDISKLDVEEKYKFVTVGMGLDVAPETLFAWQGVNLKPIAPDTLLANRDSSNDWHIGAVGHPREAERPESYIARIRRASDGVTMRDIPVVPGIRMAGILGHIIHTDGGGTWFSGTHATISNNNATGSLDPTAAYVTQPFKLGGEINMRVTVPAAPAPFLGGLVRLSFGPSDFTDPFGTIVGANLEPKNDNDPALTSITVFDWSTSQQSSFDLPTVNGVVFVRIVWSGTELRWQFSGSPINVAAAPNVILKDVPTLSDPVHFRLSMENGGPVGATVTKIENITIGGLSAPQTIYSLQQQENDNSGSGIAVGNLDVEFWQVSRYPPAFKGFSTRKVF
jgi:hypothetical protein